MTTKEILDSHELNEAIMEFCDKNGVDQDTEEGSDQIDCFILGYLAAKKDGMNDLMKAAKDVVVDDLDWQFYHYCLGVLNLTPGDKVKVLVVKEAE